MSIDWGVYGCLASALLYLVLYCFLKWRLVVDKDKKMSGTFFLAVSQRESLSLAENKQTHAFDKLYVECVSQRTLSLSCLYSRWHLKKKKELLFAHEFNPAMRLCVLKLHTWSVCLERKHVVPVVRACCMCLGCFTLSGKTNCCDSNRQCLAIVCHLSL